jgi:hypothetical protein
MNDAHRSWESARLAAARKARSVSFSSGRRTVPQHPHLVAQDGVPELELRHAPASSEHPDEANEHEVRGR